MLVDPCFIEPRGGMRSVLTIVSGGHSSSPRKVERGLYMCRHWNFDEFLDDDWDEYPEFADDVDAIGVCDSPEQFKRKAGALLEEAGDEFVVSFVRIAKDEQPSDGGWRWHKWGGYIGERQPRADYLYDEPEIDEVYTYHVYRRSAECDKP